MNVDRQYAIIELTVEEKAAFDSGTADFEYVPDWERWGIAVGAPRPPFREYVIGEAMHASDAADGLTPMLWVEGADEPFGHVEHGTFVPQESA